VEEIARLVWRETGRHEPGFVAAFFDLVTRLGLASQDDARESRR